MHTFDYNNYSRFWRVRQPGLRAAVTGRRTGMVFHFILLRLPAALLAHLSRAAAGRAAGWLPSVMNALPRDSTAEYLRKIESADTSVISSVVMVPVIMIYLVFIYFFLVRMPKKKIPFLWFYVLGKKKYLKIINIILVIMFLINLVSSILNIILDSLSLLTN